MKNLIQRAIALFFCVGICIGVNAQGIPEISPKKKVAVYMTGSNIDQSYKKVIGAKIVSAVTQSGEYAAVERTAEFLAALSAESDYQTSGEVRDSQIARLGQKFGVKYVIVADISELFDELFISSRLINVETGLVEQAYDTSGPAESMAQLIKLAQNVSSGLLGAQSAKFSNKPILLSLCAIYNGEIVYITPQQWQGISETEKNTIIKKGICIVHGHKVFIVALMDSAFGDWYTARDNHAPSLDHMTIIYNRLDELNSILKFFGGNALPRITNSFYWLKETVNKDGSEKAYIFNLYNGIFFGKAKFHTANNRPVYEISTIGI